MSQQDAGQTTADGPPKTPYRIAAFALTAVIAAYSWVFKVWDGSEFPETFTHPLYWLLLGGVFLLAGIWAFLISNKRSWLDFAIVEILFLAAAGVFVESVFVNQQAKPSAEKFTVVLFTFSDHTATKDVGNSFRDNIQRELEAKYHKEIIVLQRDREIKGERHEEKSRAARAWGSRRLGCHLAIWAELFMDKDGKNYVVNLHSVGVYPFGTQLNREEVDPFDEVNQSFVAKSASSGNAVGQDAINEAVSQIELLYGLASYEKADYDAALRILSTLGTAKSEYFAGRAAFRKAVRSTQMRQLFREAEAHFLQAITLDGNGKILGGMSYTSLGQTYDFRLLYGATDDPKGEANNAISAFSKAAEIYKKNGDLPAYSYLLVKKANVLFELSKLEESQVATTKDLNDAESAVNEALKHIKAKSVNYSEAQNVLGALYAQRGDYQKAIVAYETALRFIPVESQGYLSVTLTYLGQAQTSYGWRTRDENLYEEGMENFRRASQSCRSVSTNFSCYLAHISAGTASFNWADLLRVGSPAWTREIERAITEFGLSSNFLSKSDQAGLYAESKQLTALANTQRGLGGKGDERVRFLKAALAALSDGIDALTVAGFDTKQLYEERAQCYDRLRLNSIDQATKSEYLRLAQKDRESAKVSSKVIEYSPLFRQ